MSQWTAPITLSNANGEASFVGHVDGPAFMRALGSDLVDSVLAIDKHGETAAFEREAKSFVDQPLRAWRQWANEHPYRRRHARQPELDAMLAAGNAVHLATDALAKGKPDVPEA